LWARPQEQRKDEAARVSYPPLHLRPRLIISLLFRQHKVAIFAMSKKSLFSTNTLLPASRLNK
jgi:hypothetical protein